MRMVPTLFLPALLIAALTLSLVGCKDDSHSRATTSTALSAATSAPSPGSTYKTTDLVRQERHLMDERLLSLVGSLDADNRYSSAVMVTTNLETGAAPTHCSGVLISPHVVLTAGHCVCTRPQATLADDTVEHTINSSRCAKRALVTTVLYQASTELEPAGSRSGEYQGDVRPHPDLKLVLDNQERLLTSAADLAVILLDQPVKKISPAAVALQKELQGGESIFIVSYGYDRSNPSFHGQRRFKEYSVLRGLEPGGRFLFDQPQRNLYVGDSGGPCLRPSSAGDELVGISSRGLGHEATLTSTYFYRTWLHDELSRARPTDDRTAP